MLLTSACVGALTTTAQAIAQDAGEAGADSDAAAAGGLTEIIVTAQRREESAQKVPISMTVLGGDAMANMQTINDLAAKIPNVQIDEAQGVPRTAIRGIAQSDYNPNATTSNMVYLDDVPLNSAIAQSTLTWDLARAEVMRGPQGTLFGRNATGGAIRFIAAMPTKSWSGYADVTLGRYNQNIVNAAISGPFTDTLGVRIAYTGQRSDGDVYNTVTREKLGNDYYGIRGILEWQPSDNVHTVLRAQYFNRDAPIISWKSTPGLATKKGFGPTLDGRSVADVQAQYGYQNLGVSTNFRVAEIDGRSEGDLKHLPISFTADIDLGPVTLTSATGYLKVKQAHMTDGDSSPAPILNAYYLSSLHQWTQEIRLASNGTGPFKWILGGFYMDEKMNTRLSWDVTEWVGATLYPNANTVMNTRGQRQGTESYAVFAHTTYEVTPELMLTAAARYTWENKDIFYTFRSRWDFPTSLSSSQADDFKRAVETRNLGTLLAAAQPSLGGKDSWKNLSWKLALDYQVSPGTMLYGLVSRGFKGGSFKPTANVRSEVLNADGSILSVRPETVTDYEAGIKSNLIPGRLRVNGSIYLYDFRDYQTSQVVPDAGILAISNLPKARMFGAELEIEAVPVDDLHLNLGAGVADTSIKRSLDPTIIGNKLPFAQKFNINASMRYDLATDIGTFSPEANLKYRGKYYTSKENVVQLGDFATIDARLSYTSPGEGVYGSLWIKNLTDKRAVLVVDDPSEFWGSDIAYVNAGRTYGVTLGARF
jgi:iron complex outermembrane receptor protein